LLDNRFSGSGVYDCAAQLPDRYQRHRPHLALRWVCQRRYHTVVLDGNPHLRPGESHANGDSDANGDSNGYAYADSDANGGSDSYSDADSYANCNGDTYAYFYAQGDANAANSADAEKSPHSAAEAVAQASCVSGS
jgi:hypothetical protein